MISAMATIVTIVYDAIYRSVSIVSEYCNADVVQGIK